MGKTLHNQVYMITGSNSGIGKQTALQLAEQGATVIMACRNRERGESARQEVITQSGNSAVELLIVDMASQSSIRRAVDAFKQRHNRLDGLINNAANFDITVKNPILTENGIETVFATNHLGPFLLTHLLLDTLKASAPARILNVASKGLITYPRLDIEFDNLNGKKKFSAQHAYYHSKLAQIMFTYDLARRLGGTGVTVNCVRVPAVRVDNERLDHIPVFLRALYRLKVQAISIEPEQMAEGYVRLLTAPEFAEVAGGYYDENCKSVKSSGKSHDEATWRTLWDVSAQLTHLEETVPTP